MMKPQKLNLKMTQVLTLTMFLIDNRGQGGGKEGQRVIRWLINESSGSRQTTPHLMRGSRYPREDYK